MPSSSRLMLLLAAVMLTGCNAGGPATLAGAPASWVSRHGGLTSASARLESAALRVADAAQLDIKLFVLDSRTPAAYSWPDGSIYITDKLVALLSDDELAAVIAHELAHLLMHRAGPLPFALSDAASIQDEEARADHVGCLLLDRAGHDRRAMSRMLRKLLTALPADDSVHPQLRARLDSLR